MEPARWLGETAVDFQRRTNSRSPAFREPTWRKSRRNNQELSPHKSHTVHRSPLFVRSLYPSSHDQNDQDQEDQAESTAWTVTPIRAVRPRGQRANKK